jgi:glyoxylase-like metal-dependent hydrolase (beta-lactamase superfamily II)
MEVAPNIYLIRDSIVNAYLVVGDDGLTLIDTGLRSAARSILRAIKQIGYSPKDLRRILITHCDGDHVGGVAALKAMTTASVYAHPIEALAMSIGSPSREIDKSTLSGRLFRMFSFMFRFQPAQADVLLEQNAATELPGGMRAILTIGHTPGHVSFYLPGARVLFGGDSLMVDGGKLCASHGPNTWDQAKADESARIQAALGAQVVCLGHGLITQQASSKFML